MNLRVEHLRFRYRQKSRYILDDVSFSVPSGNFCTILGANGAGKSTLIKCINQILKPESGTAYADDIDLSSISCRERAKLVGYVPQSSHVKSGLNVLETILSGCSTSLHHKPGPEDLDLAYYLMERLNLSAYAFSDLVQLSGGERQRVLIARALAQNPQIMLLDEPTSNLDIRYQLEIMELLEQLCREDHITVLTIIHDLSTALRFGDKTILLNHNHLIAEGVPAEVLTEKRIHMVYGIGSKFGNVDSIPVIVPFKTCDTA